VRTGFAQRKFALIVGVAAVVLAATPLVWRVVRAGRHAPSSATAPLRPASPPTESPPSPVDPRLVPARDALARQDYVEALRACRAARKGGAPLPAVLETEAEIFKATAYLDREIEALKRWAIAVPRDHRPWLKLFYIYLDLGWRPEARQASERALRLAPDDPRSHVARALFYYRSEDAALGVKAIEAARRLAPERTEYIHLHASLLLKARRSAEAEATIRQALARDPSRPSDNLLLAQALLAQDRQQEAAAVLQNILQSHPDDIDARYHLGLLAQKRGDVAEATRYMERVAAQDRGYSNTLWILGRLYVQQGREAEGRELLQTFKTMEERTGRFETLLSRLRTRPDDPGLHHQLARQRLAADELPQAIVELRRTLELRPHDARARADLIAALKRHGRRTEAAQLERAPVPPSGNREP